MTLHVLLFVSALADNVAADVVVSIAAQARRNNALSGITGLLVFDGEHFAQLMEGPAEAVLKVSELMRWDHRHLDMEVLYSETSAKSRRFPAWRLGYLLMDLQEFGLQSLRGQRGQHAMSSFDFMLPTLDIAVGEAIPNSIAKKRL